jgi:hypothetical protein
MITNNSLSLLCAAACRQVMVNGGLFTWQHRQQRARWAA